jgi:nucleotide-binding universal stress UspA family protein
MAKRVLVPIDGSEQARTALEYALEEFAEETVTILTVIDPREFNTYGGVEGWVDLDDLREQRRDQAEKLLEDARERAEGRGLTVDTDVVTGKVARAIIEYAEEHGIDHVVLGSHGRSGISRVLLGSVAENVVRRSPVPVTVVR